MAGRRASRRMPQTLAHSNQPADCPVQFLCLRRQHSPIDARLPVCCSHIPKFIKRKTCGTPHRDECQAFQYTRIVQTVQTASAD